MRIDQDRVFSHSEGNRWFDRNKEALKRFDPSKDFALRLLDMYHLHPRRVLEIGAANGVRLAAITGRYGVRAVAVEPSAKAIADGKRRFPSIKYVRASAARIPLRESFDLIILNFVLHWVDRTSLLRSVAEIDRLLDDKGYLMIGDFLPVNLMRVRYHHIRSQHVYTYKQNYAAVFIASGLYHMVGLLSGDHGSRACQPMVDENERFGTWLLQKRVDHHYLELPCSA